MATDSDKRSRYEYRYKSDYMSDWDIHRNYVNENFNAWEAMLIGQVYDSVSGSVDGSKITDSYASTLAKERADRVIAKLPEGETESLAGDVGKAMFMDLLRQKWYYRNANAQHSFLEKLNMWQLYSSVYGYMPMFYDWNIANSGYVGPDCWLFNPRNLVPQQGRVSIDDMDYVTALTWVGKSYIDKILDLEPDEETPQEDVELSKESGWNYDALKELRDAANHKQDVDWEKDTKIARDRTPLATRKGICLATRYESGDKGEWVTFAPDHGFVEIRRIKNPHKNGRIPFVIKYSQPLFDSFYGLGDFQKAKPLQFARDGLTNFYFKGIKMNLIPPIIANANGVMKHTLDYREGAVMLETIPNSIRRLETSTAGLATYKDAQSNLTGSLLSLYGTGNASSPGAETLNPSQGKTPQAISMYSDKEATRDGAERRHLETAIESLTDAFNTLTLNIGSETIPISLFEKDIEDLVKMGYADVLKMFKKTHKLKLDSTGSAISMQVDPAALKGVEYRFNIRTDSTVKVNKDAQRQSVVDAIGMLGKMQNVFQTDPRIIVHWEKIMKSYQALSDVPGADEWIEYQEDAQKPAETPPEPQPEITDIQTPSGMTVDSTDLIRMYIGSDDWAVKSQIAELLGFQPGEEPVEEVPEAEPIIGPDGEMFSDAAVGNAATNLFNSIPDTPIPMPSEPTPQTPTVSGNGSMFQDSDLASVSDAISKMS